MIPSVMEMEKDLSPNKKKELKKRRYNPTETKQILINAAETLFIKKGFAATSTDEISKLARCSKSQIQYHFTTKENLWKAVIENRLNDFLKAIEKLFVNITNDKENFKKGIISFFKFLKKKPQIVSIIRWTTIEGLPTDFNLRDRILQITTGTINRAKDKGIINKELDPNYIVYAILGIIFHWFDMGGNQSGILKSEESLKAKDMDYVDTIVKIIFDGIFSEKA